MAAPVIRPAASSTDKLAVLAVAHAANASTRPLLEYQARRLHHHRRSRATWWLLREDDGEVASGMVCHPLRFSVGGEELPGFGVGAVVTRPDRRRRGHASALCAHVAEVCADEGRPTGLLFSAIPPALYERLGYRVLPAWDFRCKDPAGFAQSGHGAGLRALDPRADATALLSLYRRHHDERNNDEHNNNEHSGALHLLRDEAAWECSLREGPDDLFFGWGEPLAGYVRLYEEEDGEVDVVELITPDPADETPVLRAVASLVLALGRPEFGGWMTPSAAPSDWFDDAGRDRTRPMLRGLESVTDARFWASDYF